MEGRDGGVRISWRGRTAGGVRAFDVLRSVEEKGARFQRIGTLEPMGTRRYVWLDRAVEPGREYRYRVRPRREDPVPGALRFTGPQGQFAWSEPPPAPTGVASSPLNAGARLTWDPVPDVDGYRVYELEKPGGPSKQEPHNRGLVDNTSWTAVALPDGKSRCYVVRAVKLPPKLSDARGRGSLPEETAEAEPSVEDPDDEVEAPSGAEVADAAAKGITIPRQNAGREVRRALSELAGEGPLPGIESASSEPTCTTPGLTEPPPPPKLVTPALTDEGISLAWKKSPGEDVAGYHVERAEIGADGTPGSFERLTVKPVDVVSFVDRSVQKGKTYQYQVRAVDSGGSEGAPSSPTDPRTFP